MINLDAPLIAKAGKGTLLVDFYADWCQPCKSMALTMKKLESKYEDIVFGKLDIDAHPAVADKFDVKSIPTLLLLQGSKEVGRIVGAVPEVKVRELLDKGAK